MTAPLSKRQLDAIGQRIRSHGDMHIRIRHVTLARLIVSAGTGWSFGQRVMDHCPDSGYREVDACALNALLLLAEDRLPRPAPSPVRHVFQPHRKYPWFCDACGYGRAEGLKHFQPVEQEQAA